MIKNKITTKLKLKKNLKNFKKLELDLKREPSKEKAFYLMDLAVHYKYPVHYSEVIENFFMNLAKKTKNLRKDYKKIKPKVKTYLHVMTESYLHGGHTRIVERWIGSSSKLEKHSLVLTGQRKEVPIPDLLRKAVKDKKGNLVIFDCGDSIESKANKLRDFAFEYDVIILHHHPRDPVPLMAFSVSEFNRSVIYFNHAGLSFWIGRGIIDFCLDIEKNQNFMTIKKRGVKNNRIINMPVDKIYPLKKKKFNFYKKLGFKKTDKIISSMTRMMKCQEMDGLSFTKTLRKILKKDEDTVFIGIGIEDTTMEWRKLSEEFGRRVRLLGIVSHDKIKDYLQASDLYLDSFPFNSWLSLTDAINIGQVPCVLLKTPLGYLSYLEGSEIICENTNEVVEKSLLYLNNKRKSEEVRDDLIKRLKEKCSLKVFKKEIAKVIEYVKKVKKDDSRFLRTEDFLVPIDYYMYNYKAKKFMDKFKHPVVFFNKKIKKFKNKKIIKLNKLK